MDIGPIHFEKPPMSQDFLSAYRSEGGTLVPMTSLRMTFQPPLLRQPEKIERFADLMRKGQPFPPVQVRKNGDGYQLLDGYHRQQASHQCSFTHIPVDIIQM
jgi:ParB-like chromosome segregation protein Spo0J